VTVASRKVLAQRAEENGEEFRAPQSPKPSVLSRLRKAKNVDMHSELHGAFFRQSGSSGS
jgi:hypothetical protein